MALNKTNGDFYIGATEKGTLGRASVHKWQARHGEKKQHFYRAIRKYGESSFRFLTIKECVDYWDALESERSYIALMKPTYNMTEGGGGVKGHKHSQESKAKMSAAKKGKPGRKMTEAMRLDLSKRKTGVKINVSNIGKEKFRINARLANIARRRGVICLTDGIEYQSLTDAARAYGLTTGAIAYHCSGEHKSRRGLQFRYINKVGND